MGAAQASDEVTDLIASIEMHRQELAKESGLEASRQYALRRLQQALREEQEALQLHGPSPERLANAEAVKAEITRVKSLAGAAGQRAAARKNRPRPQKSWRSAQPKASKPRGRRTMGHGGGR